MRVHPKVENHLCASAVVRGVVTSERALKVVLHENLEQTEYPWWFPVLLLGNEQHVAQTGLLGAECLGEGNHSFKWHKMISHAYNRINKTDITIFTMVFFLLSLLS